MLSVIQNKSLEFLETIVTKLDSYEELQKRQRIFAQKQQEEQDLAKKAKEEDQDHHDVNDEAKEKFKQLSLELIDIGLHTGQKGLHLLQQTKPYALTDQYIHYDKRVEEVKNGSVKLYHFLNDKLYNPLKNNLYVIYDQGSNYISFMVKILKEHQHKVADYILKNYNNVTVLLQDNWMRLDLNKDGHVSIEDLRRAVQELYEFMVNYDYFEKATEIKSTLYHQAIKFMKKEVRSEEGEEH